MHVTFHNYVVMYCTEHLKFLNQVEAVMMKKGSTSNQIYNSSYSKYIILMYSCSKASRRRQRKKADIAQGTVKYLYVC